VGYAREVLKVELTPMQAQIAESLLVPPHRVLVRSANTVGKSFLAACLVNWYYDCFDPGICITTAPDARSIKDTCWKEVRVLRNRSGRDDFSGDKAPEQASAPNHYAKGYTVRPGASQSFQGRHDAGVFLLYEEASGLDPVYWETGRTLHKPEPGFFWLGIFNPDDDTSAVHVEESIRDLGGQPFWKVFELSALDHPNIVRELNGLPPLVPNAVTLAQLEALIGSWCRDVTDEPKLPQDFPWRPPWYCAQHGTLQRWYRPGPEFEVRGMGRWPSHGGGVWSEALWEKCVHGEPPSFPLAVLPQVGVDCALGKGDDFHAIHARWGCRSVHHETSNTMSPEEIFLALVRVARKMAELANLHRHGGAAPVKPEQIPLVIEDDMIGNVLGDRLMNEGFNVHLLSAGGRPDQGDRYLRRRDELWFSTARKADLGQVWLGDLDQATRERLRQQLLAVGWRGVRDMLRKVDSKEEIKEKIRRSPDDADALNLAYYDGLSFVPTRGVDTRQGLSPLYGRSQHAHTPAQESPPRMTPGWTPIAATGTPQETAATGTHRPGDDRFGDNDFYGDHFVGDDGRPGGGGLWGRALGRR
jgi:hypothetical protein